MATTVPLPLDNGFASFFTRLPYDAVAVVQQMQQVTRPGLQLPGMGPLTASAATLFVLGGCTGELSALDPAGPAARSIAHIWYIMAWSSAAIFVFMVLLGIWACLRRSMPHEKTHARLFLLGGGIIFPGTVLLALLIYGLRAGDAQAPLHDEADAYRVEVHAHQWWWEVRYPDVADESLTSRNEIHAPAGRPLYISVSTQDVIHSFWIPRLGGKIDAIPGRVNTIRLVADEPGVYRGVCAEFCGTGHATMPIQLNAYDQVDLEAALAGLVPGPDAASVSQHQGEPAKQVSDPKPLLDGSAGMSAARTTFFIDQESGNE